MVFANEMAVEIIFGGGLTFSSNDNYKTGFLISDENPWNISI